MNDELPPHSNEYEQALLGALLTDARVALPICQEIINGDVGVFWHMGHQTIYRAICDVSEQGHPVETMTVFGQLNSAGLLDGCGGIGYIASLPDKCASPAGAAYFAQSLVEIAQKRRAQALGMRLASSAVDPTIGPEELIAEATQELTRIYKGARTDSRPIRELVQGSISEMEACHQNQGRLEGIPTGFPDLDKITQGLHPSEMIVVAGRPSTGKTSLAMNIAEHIAVDQGLAVGVFSLEMTAQSLVTRMLCSRARVNLRNIREGFLAERDFQKITDAAGKIAKSSLHIDDSAGLSIFELRAKAHRMSEQHGIKVLVVDYLQLMKGSNRKNGTRENEVSEISSGCKALAKDLNIPVVVLSQLNRELEKDKRGPRLSDLRESGSIEQDADLVAMLWRPATRDKDADESDLDAMEVTLSIRKQRNGPTGDIPLVFLKGYTRFESACKVESTDHRNPYTDE